MNPVTKPAIPQLAKAAVKLEVRPDYTNTSRNYGEDVPMGLAQTQQVVAVHTGYADGRLDGALNALHALGREGTPVSEAAAQYLVHLLYTKPDVIAALDLPAMAATPLGPPEPAVITKSFRDVLAQATELASLETELQRGLTDSGNLGGLSEVLATKLGYSSSLRGIRLDVLAQQVPSLAEGLRELPIRVAAVAKGGRPTDALRAMLEFALVSVLLPEAKLDLGAAVRDVQQPASAIADPFVADALTYAEGDPARVHAALLLAKTLGVKPASDPKTGYASRDIEFGIGAIMRDLSSSNAHEGGARVVATERLFAAFPELGAGLEEVLQSKALVQLVYSGAGVATKAELARIGKPTEYVLEHARSGTLQFAATVFKQLPEFAPSQADFAAALNVGLRATQQSLAAGTVDVDGIPFEMRKLIEPQGTQWKGPSGSLEGVDLEALSALKEAVRLARDAERRAHSG